MQNAETTLAIIRDHWRAVCGESCKHGSGGGSWKRPGRDLARSLPYQRTRRSRRTDAVRRGKGLSGLVGRVPTPLEEGG